MTGRALVIAALLGAAAIAPAQDEAPARPAVLFLDFPPPGALRDLVQAVPARDAREAGFQVARGDGHR